MIPSLLKRKEKISFSKSVCFNNSKNAKTNAKKHYKHAIRHFMALTAVCFCKIVSKEELWCLSTQLDEQEPRKRQIISHTEFKGLVMILACKEDLQNFIRDPLHFFLEVA